MGCVGQCMWDAMVGRVGCDRCVEPYPYLALPVHLTHLGHIGPDLGQSPFSGRWSARWVKSVLTWASCHFHAGVTMMRPHDAHPPPSPHLRRSHTLNHATCPPSPFTHLLPTCPFNHLACPYEDVPLNVRRADGVVDAPGEPLNAAYVKARTRTQSSTWPG